MNGTVAVQAREDQVRLGLWMFLATVTMLFAAFASAYIVRRSGSDWHAVSLPSILWINTAVLAASSAALEGAHWWGTAGRWGSARSACMGAVGLGFAFLWGQATAWRSMAASGMYLSTNPHASFFFVLTGAHGVHVVAAVVVLVWGASQTWRGHRDERAWAAKMELCRTFWHFLGVVWVALFALLALY